MKVIMNENEKDFVMDSQEILQDLRIETDTKETEKGIVFSSEKRI